MYEVILGFYSCTDYAIFEWCEDEKLWLGQRGFNTLRWVDGKCCLSYAGSIRYSEKNEYDTLIDLIKGCISEIREY